MQPEIVNSVDLKDNERIEVVKLEPDTIELQGLSAVVTDGYNIDKNSLTEMTKSWEECKKLVSMMPENKGGRFEGASNVNIPIVLNAAQVFNARSYPAFFQSNDIVKCEVIGDDSGLFMVAPGQNGQPQVQKVIKEPGAKEKRAMRISQHMSWQLTYQMSHWIEDMDKLLTLSPIYGMMFKKVYYNSYTKKNCSELIMPQYLTVHNETRDLQSAPRITHSYGLYPYEIQERIGAGYFDPFTYAEDDSGEMHEFLEQHLRYDLDGDGYDEPLIVTVHTESSTVVRVEKRYIDSDVTKKAGKIIKIEAENFFIAYPFMPNPTGGFYGIGFGYLLYQLNKCINTTVNQLVDAGTAANNPFFFLERGRMKGGEVKVRYGFGLFVNNDSRPLRDSIYQMEFKGPDSVLFQMLGFLFEYARNLGGMREVLEGGMRSDQATGTTQLLVQEGMNEFKAIHKRIWRALSHEYKRLFDLNHRYMDEKEYFKVLDDQESLTPGRAEILRADYNSDDFDVRPVADIEYLTNAQKQADADFCMQLAEAGRVNPQEATKRALQSRNIANIDKLLTNVPTDQQTQLQAQQLQQQQEELKIEAERTAAHQLKEANAKRKLDIEEAKTIFSIDKMRAETVDTLAQAEQRAHDSDLQALEIIQNNMSDENEKRIEQIAQLSQQQGITQPQQGVQQ